MKKEKKSIKQWAKDHVVEIGIGVTAVVGMIGGAALAIASGVGQEAGYCSAISDIVSNMTGENGKIYTSTSEAIDDTKAIPRMIECLAGYVENTSNGKDILESYGLVSIADKETGIHYIKTL